MSAPDATRLLRRSRWGILIGALVTGGVLLALSWRNYNGVRESSDTLARGQAVVFVDGIHQALREVSMPPTDEDIASILAAYADDGLRYIAVLGHRVFEAGDPVGEQPPRPPGDRTHIAWIGSRVRVSAGRPGGPGPGGPHRGPPMHGLMRRHAGGPELVLEFEPLQANALRARARGALIGSAGAAAAIWLAALVAFVALRRLEAREAKRLRERHLAALGEMSAVLAHEIRNPLASLKGHAQLLAESLPDDEPRRDKADRVVGDAVRLEELTTGLLDFVRTGQIRREPAAPGALLRAAAAEVDGDRIDIDVGEAPETWSLDPVRTRQVLTNVLRNAVQASPEGARVAATARVASGRLLFEIADAGPGIPDGDEQRIFEPFHTGRVRGTGLGLAVAKRVVELHGGEISAHNRSEGGAVFRIAIPG